MQAPIRFTSAVPGAITQRQGDQQALQQFFDRNKVEKARMEQIKSLKQLAKGYGASAAQVESSSYGELQGFVQRMELEKADKTREEQARLRELQMEQSRQAMELAREQADAARGAREAPANFLRMMAGPAGTPDEIMDAIGRRLEASPPPPGTAPAVYGTAEELEAAGIAEMQRQADLKRAEADLGTLGQPLSEASNARFLNRFLAEQDPAVARLALGEFVRRDTPKPGGSIRTVMVDGKPKIAMLDSAGNIVRIVGDAPASGKWVHTPEEREKITRTELESKGAFDFLQNQRDLATSEAAVIRPASRALRLLESDIQTGGAFADFKTNLVTTLSSLGVPLPKSITDEAKDSEEFRAQVGEFLFLNIQKTKGSISEKEMDIFKEISPNLGMSTAANKSLLKYTIGIAERNKRKIKYIQELRRSKIPLSEQQNKLEDWMLENDLSELVSAIPSGRGGSVNTIQVDLGGGQTAVGQQIGVNAAGERLFKLQDGRVVTENKAATAP